jgi:hypothetical protein
MDSDPTDNIHPTVLPMQLASGFSTLAALCDHRRERFLFSGESQSLKLSLLPLMSPTLLPPAAHFVLRAARPM